MSQENPDLFLLPQSSRLPHSTEEQPIILTADHAYCNGEYLAEEFWQQVEAFRQSGRNVLIESTEDGYVATIN